MNNSVNLLCTALLALADQISPASLKYIKRQTRESTRQATLSATGLPALPGRWHLIGPFDNTDRKGFAAVYPPEIEIDLSKSYVGKSGRSARWRPVDFPDGQIHNLKQFGAGLDEYAVVYLYRQIEVEKPTALEVSIGSDDSLKVFLNGQPRLMSDAVRTCAPDQERLTLNLAAGRNQLLLKICQVQGEWQFYFSPALPLRLETQLRNRLEADFPVRPQEHAYRMVRLPIPEEVRPEVGGMGFRRDGSLLVGTRRGKIWLIKNPTDETFADFTITEWASGLHEITGMLVHDDAVYVAQRPELTVVRDRDNDGRADEFRTLCDLWGLSGNYHEYVFGPVRDSAGNLYLALNLAFGGGHPSRAPYRGWCVRVTPHGSLEPVASGLRSPNGLGVNPEGNVFVCDNQGEWVAACKLHQVRDGEFYGHPASLRWRVSADTQPPVPTPPSVWFPYGSMSQSASEPVWDTTAGKFGPFSGQCFIGDQTRSVVMRVALEKVAGKYQGACFGFRGGFDCGVNRLAFAPDGSLFAGLTSRGWGSVGGDSDGLARLVYTGNPPFEIHSICHTPSGFRLRFTRRVDATTASSTQAYEVQSYRYHYWATYGSPEVDRRPTPVRAVRVRRNRQAIDLELPALETGRVYEVSAAGVRSESGSPLIHPLGYYTLNHRREHLPDDDAGD
jgi:hypothetical protein